MAALSHNALAVLRQRYLLRDSHGTIRETPAQLFRRVAHAVAAAELQWHPKKAAQAYARKFYSLMKEMIFLPNSPTLMNAGTHWPQLSACFVLPLSDNLSSIFETLHQAAIIQQSGGGTGFDFTPIRPHNAGINGCAGKAGGPISFLHIFDTTTACIKQGGRRRGANMGVLHITHPDIESFIHAKAQKGALRQFNLSVGISDRFMHAVQHNSPWQLMDPASGKTVKEISAVALWQQMVHAAWQHGDPGVLFIDTINRHNPTPALGRITCTNPCGEVPLLPYESCNLGSINVAAFVQQKHLDYRRLAQAIHTAVRFLDDVIEVNQYPFPAFSAMAKENRKIGLGIMGWADALIKMGIPYDSDAAVEKAEKLMQFFAAESQKASALLAAKRGVFPQWEKSIYAPHRPLRNATVNSIAPTGTISIIADASASIEPLFALAFHRQHALNNQPLPTFNKHVQALLEKEGYWKSAVIHHIKATGSVAEMKQLPLRLRKLLKTATEIPPMRHLQHQMAFQRFTDNAVAKTINLPASATEKEVAEIFEKAWASGAKGITVFRSVPGQPKVLVAGTLMQTCNVCKLSNE